MLINFCTDLISDYTATANFLIAFGKCVNLTGTLQHKAISHLRSPLLSLSYLSPSLFLSLSPSLILSLPLTLFLSLPRIVSPCSIKVTNLLVKYDSF